MELEHLWLKHMSVSMSTFAWRTQEVSCPISLPLCLSGSKAGVCCLSLTLNSRSHPMGGPPLYESKVKLCKKAHILQLGYPSKH